MGEGGAGTIAGALSEPRRRRHGGLHVKINAEGSPPPRISLERSLRTAIEAALQRDGMSVNRLAELSGVKGSQLSRFLARKRSITLGTAAALAAVLELELRPIKPGAPVLNTTVDR